MKDTDLSEQYVLCYAQIFVRVTVSKKVDRPAVRFDSMYAI